VLIREIRGLLGPNGFGAAPAFQLKASARAPVWDWHGVRGAQLGETPFLSMSQTELLSSVRLRLSESVRRSSRQKDCMLLRSAAGRRRLVLTPAQAKILTDFFAQPVTVPEVLAQLIGQRCCPPLGEYYELVLQAHAAGVLVAEFEPEEYSLATRWRLRVPLRVAALAGNAVVVLGTLALVLAPAWPAPAGWLEWVEGWLGACLLLSAGEALAACVLAGGECQVRDARLHWFTLLPHFRIDAAEAAMGGRVCELAVAALRVAPIAAGAAALAWKYPGLLAPVLAGGLYVLAPWGRSAAWQWLGARRARPRFSVDSGFLFEPRYRDAWARWRAWWAGGDATFRLLSLGWALAWGVLVVVTGRHFFPAAAGEIVAKLRPSGRLSPLVSAAFYSLVAAGIIAVFAVIRAVFRHWWLRRQWARPLRGGIARGDAADALSGDIPAVLRQVALFQTLAGDDLAALAEVMETIQVSKREVVFREDDPGDAFYLVLEGQLEILKRRPKPSRRSTTIGWLGPGHCFGEIALLEGGIRTATIQARSAGRLLRLAKADFERLVLHRVGAARVRELLQYATFLGRLVFSAGWPFNDLVRYAQCCGTVQFDAGARALRLGEPNLWFYLIYDGAFEARDGDRVRRMQPGDYFGEIGLLGREEATAEVVAIEEGRCLTLARDDFLSFFAKDFRIALRMEALAAQRLGTRVFVSR
jgi:CRP-like cAMP-binding protein